MITSNRLNNWVISLMAAVAFQSPAVTHGNPVLDWNGLMIDAIRSDNSGPTLSSRNLAILHTAIYDAVNSIAPTHQPYRQLVDPPGEASPDAAAVAAAYAVTTTLYPALKGAAANLYDQFIASEEPSLKLTNGLAVGAEVARAFLAERGSDGANTDYPYIPSSDPGQWRRTPPFFRPPLAPNWRYVTPFGVDDVSLFVPPPPPALDSPEYAAAFNEVKQLGGKISSSRTEYQRETAVFWSDFSYTSMPPGHWHLISAEIARARGLNLEQTARLFALLSIVQADAAIVCWETKYRYNLWRPVTAIQRAGEDGNSMTEADPSWDHLLAAPPFPAYSSGHSAFSKASAQILAHYFGADAITFTATSDTLPGVTRTYDSLSACADEIGMSRIYGGIHFAFDIAGGNYSGKKISNFVSRNYLMPTAELPALSLESVQGEAGIRVHAAVGSEAVLESSTDLRHWHSISTNTAAPGGALVMHPIGMGHQFYRVKNHAGDSL